MVFWDVMLYSLVDCYQLLKELATLICLQGTRVNKAWKEVILILER
jgi:hypothetical protein